MGVRRQLVLGLRKLLGVDIYRRDGHPWGARQMWDDAARLARIAQTTAGSAVAFDVGAHRGATVDKLRSLGLWSAIHAFEPFPASVAELRELIGSDSGLILHAAAVSDIAGVATLHLTASDQSHSLMMPGLGSEDASHPHHPIGTVTVDTVTLDAVAESHGVDRINLLKIDVQGGELAVLRGANKLLSEGRIDVILSEVEFQPLYKNQPLFWDIAEYARQMGLVTFGLYCPRPAPSGQISWADAIFCRPELLKAGAS